MRVPRFLQSWIQRLARAWLQADPAAVLASWRRRLRRRSRAESSAGLVMPVAVLAVLLVILGTAVLAARSVSSWLRGVSNADLRAAREAAEYGFNEIVGQLNTDNNAYLLVTNFANWQDVSADDLAACQVSATTAPTSNRIAGVSSNSSNKTQALPNNGALSYSLTGFNPPALPFGRANFVAGGSSNACTGATSAAKFGNLKGGSAKLEVTGTVTRGGGTVASYKLTRMVHVKWPNDSLANPMLFLGLGSQLKFLDGNICTTTNTAATSCNGLPRTVIGCIDLEDCLVKNVDEVSGKQRDKYCKQGTKKYKKGVICNNFQQASDVLPNFPTPADYNDTSAFASGGGNPPNFSCSNSGIKINKDGTLDLSNYKSSCTITPYNTKTNSYDSKSAVTNTDAIFPYAGKSAPTSDAGLATATYISGCTVNKLKTAINCIFNNFITSGDELVVRTAYSTVMKKTTTVITPGLPVNIFVRGSMNLSNGGILNNSVANWGNLRLFGASSGDSSANCNAQTFTAIGSKTKKSGIGVDGAFVWFPNATITYQSAAGKSAAYLVMWVCKFTGPSSGKSGDFWIVNPLSRRGINGGLKSALAGYGSNVNATTYRAYGVAEP